MLSRKLVSFLLAGIVAWCAYDLFDNWLGS